MNSRFPPQPSKIIVPLYPNTYVIRKSVSLLLGYRTQDFISIISSHYEVEPYQILLASRASEALMLFLNLMRLYENSSLKVAIPSFCCSEVVEAILASGSIPYFMEINEDSTLPEKSIYDAKALGCRVMILPQFFGDRFHPHSDLIQKLGMISINDEAQSFPSKFTNEADISLFSCGLTKKISGVGGGGLCIHNINLAKLFIQKNHESFLNRREMIAHIKLVIKRRLIEFDQSIANFFKLTSHLEQDLKILLEKKMVQASKMTFSPMSQYQQQMAVLMLQKYQSHKIEHQIRTKYLKTVVEEIFGYSSLSLIREIENPSIFAIRVPSRYHVSSKLSQRGIQTTWYYYPLNRLFHFASENTPVTDKIAEEILILPFQWKHSSKHFTKLCEELVQ